jgi:hypothetical protein
LAISLSAIDLTFDLVILSSPDVLAIADPTTANARATTAITIAGDGR